VSPNGREAVTADSGTGEVIQWNLDTLEHVRTLHRSQRGQKSAKYSHDGREIVSVERGGVVHVWSRVDGVEQLTFAVKYPDGSPRFVWCADFTPDDQHILTTTHTKASYIVWSRVDGRRVAEKSVYDNPYTVQFAPDGKTFYSGLWSNKVIRGSIDTMLVDEFTEHVGPVLDVALSRDGCWLLSTSWDGSCRLWDTKTMEARWEYQGRGAVLNRAVSLGGGRFAASNSGGRILVFDPSYSDEFTRLQRGAHEALAVLTHKPDDATAILSLARWCALREAWGLARDFYLLAAEGGAEIASDELAMAHWMTGDLKQAGPRFEEALEQGLLDAQRGQLILESLASSMAAETR